MLKLLPILFLLTLSACSSDESAPTTVENGTEDATTESTPNPMVEAPTPSMEELLAGIPEEPVPDAPENLTRAQRDGERVEIVSEPEPTEDTSAPATESNPRLSNTAIPTNQPESAPAAAAPPATKPEPAPAIEQAAATVPISPPSTATPLSNPTPSGTSTLVLEGAAVAKEVVDRMPQGSGPFKDGQRVWTWSKIQNEAGSERAIRHVYFRDGEEIISVKLRIGGVSWRTWSRTHVHGAGQWRVDIVDDQGVLLDSLPFVVID